MANATSPPSSSLLPDLRCFVLIVGNARSGSTLLGAALDGHPRAIVANEMADSMTLWKNLARDEVLARVISHAGYNASKDRASAGYNYQIGPPPGEKRGVLVAGDKTWNPTLLLLHGNPAFLTSLEDRLAVPVRLVYAVRNPFDVIATMHRRTGLSVRDRTRWYFMHCEAAEALRARLPVDRFLESHHAEFLADPTAELGRLGRFLGLPDDPDHVAAVRDMLFAEPRKTSAALAWNAADLADIEARMAAFECLTRYRATRPANAAHDPETR